MKNVAYFSLLIGALFILIFIDSCESPSKRKQNSRIGITTESKSNRKPIVEMKGDYICISLNNYFQEVNRLIQSKKSVTADLDSLFGMSWMEGYVIDKQNRDIILIGKGIKSRPTYHTEDLIVNFQNVFRNENYPYCSLDPYPENIKKLNNCLNNQTCDFESTIKSCRDAIGGQKIVVGGVPRNSRHAKIMIFADYDMKKISQGLLENSGIRSCLDFSMQDTVIGNRHPEQESTMSRFWFHIKRNKGRLVYPTFNENEGIVLINECPVVVLTESQISDAEGNLKDNKREMDKSAELFAAEMSNKFADLANKKSIFAELENLFRLQACFKAIQIKNAISTSEIDLNYLDGFSLMPGNDLPESLPGLINFKIREKSLRENGGRNILRHLYIVAGGVSQEMTITKSNLFYEESIRNFSDLVINSRPKPESIHWITHFTDSKTSGSSGVPPIKQKDQILIKETSDGIILNNNKVANCTELIHELQKVATNDAINDIKIKFENISANRAKVIIQSLQIKMECNLHEGDIFKITRDKYDFSRAKIEVEKNGDISVVLTRKVDKPNTSSKITLKGIKRSFRSNVIKIIKDILNRPKDEDIDFYEDLKKELKKNKIEIQDENIRIEIQDCIMAGLIKKHLYENYI